MSTQSERFQSVVMCATTGARPMFHRHLDQLAPLAQQQGTNEPVHPMKQRQSQRCCPGENPNGTACVANRLAKYRISHPVRQNTQNTLGDDILRALFANPAQRRARAEHSTGGQDPPGRSGGRHPAWQSSSLEPRECPQWLPKTAPPMRPARSSAAQDNPDQAPAGHVASRPSIHHRPRRLQTPPIQEQHLDTADAWPGQSRQSVAEGSGPRSWPPPQRTELTRQVGSVSGSAN